MHARIAGHNERFAAASIEIAGVPFTADASGAIAMDLRAPDPDRRLQQQVALAAGDEVDVLIEKLEDKDGMVVLSKEKADKLKVWDEISEALEEKTKSYTLDQLRTAGLAEIDPDVAEPAQVEADQAAVRAAQRLDSADVPTAGQALVHVLFYASLQGVCVRGPMVGGEQAFVLVRDWLVLGLGDSNGSGEGIGPFYYPRCSRSTTASVSVTRA